MNYCVGHCFTKGSTSAFSCEQPVSNITFPRIACTITTTLSMRKIKCITLSLQGSRERSERSGGDNKAQYGNCYESQCKTPSQSQGWSFVGNIARPGRTTMNLLFHFTCDSLVVFGNY